ncbi:radical SAM protein [Anaerolinea sp.]|uniref:radical SAM protein n=1 Tax=Anaerolinea sp. TaxID=1872519 RepID=UPI002ACD5A9D|nr:radical SAM protein [Anaerolinea sp.]
MTAFVPAYWKLLESGELQERVQQAYARLESCEWCPRRCRVNRLAGKLGVCHTGERARVASYGPHYGEERPLSGWKGSGTVFFNRCNLRCVFCQNHDISQTDEGMEVTPEQLAQIFLRLQAMGCHNINLVSPSHVVPQILAGVFLAAQAGLRLPLVYNTGGYDALEALQLLDGVVDIYMPDMKYADAAVAKQYSGVKDYPQVNRAAVREMHRQVGDLKINAQGLAERGLLVRHLVLPHRLAGTREIMKFLAEEISPNTYVNVMGQYRPEFLAERFPLLNRRVTLEEVYHAREEARRAGLNRLDE